MPKKRNKKKDSETGKRASKPDGGKALEKGWEKCPECGIPVKSKNLSRHIKNVHNDGTTKRKAQETPNLIKTRFIPVLVIGIIVVACISGYILLNCECITGSQDENFDDESLDGGDTPDAGPIDGSDGSNDGTDGYDTGDYNPQYSYGSGDDDWWISYPSQHPNAGSDVSHPQWVLDSLKNKPVIILVHSEGCYPCIVQQEDVDTVLKDYGSNVVYYDLLSDGSDPRAYDVFNAYDPNGGQSYIPLTVIVTLIDDGNGNVHVAWHSSEGTTGEEWLRIYIQDAMYYHNQNHANWGGA